MSGFGGIGFGAPATPPASVDGAGTLPADLYQGLVGEPPTAPTAAIDTSAASGSYSEATVTNVASTIDAGTIANLSYRRCHDTGQAAARTLMPLMLLPGFGGSGTEFSTATLRRFASYGFLVISPTTRGRGSAGETFSDEFSDLPNARDGNLGTDSTIGFTGTAKYFVRYA